MDEKMKFEIRRKVFHFFSISFIFIYFYISRYFSHRAALLTLTLILIFLLFIEFVKIKYQAKVPLFHSLYRDIERNGFSGAIFLTIGAIISFAVFDFEIAVTALLMMIFGDMASSLVNLRFGKHRINNIQNASWEGVIAEFVVNMVVGIIFLDYFFIVFFMAFTATLVETILNSPDDNLTVPVLSGFVGQGMLILSRILGLI